MKYRLINDDEGHWYVFPMEKEKEVHDYFYQLGLYCLGEQDFEPDLPDFMKQIDGPHRLTFENPIEE